MADYGYCTRCKRQHKRGSDIYSKHTKYLAQGHFSSTKQKTDVYGSINPKSPY